MSERIDAVFDTMRSDIHGAFDELRASLRPTITYHWRWLAWGEYGLVEYPAGRIVGRVANHWTYSEARTEVRSLGEFIDQESAQEAVRGALMIEREAMRP